MKEVALVYDLELTRKEHRLATRFKECPKYFLRILLARIRRPLLDGLVIATKPVILRQASPQVSV